MKLYINFHSQNIHYLKNRSVSRVNSYRLTMSRQGSVQKTSRKLDVINKILHV